MDALDRRRRGRSAPGTPAGALVMAAVVVVALVGGAGRATASPGQEGTPTTEDPDLDQTISADEPVVSGAATIDAGHIDIGPRLVDDAWALLVHDDTADPPAWRSLDDTVLQVRDTAVRAVPDDDAYSFLGVLPGTPVHVVPQTEHPEVVWVGWNTQDPGAMAGIDRGATLTLHGVQGPGELTMYLQSGNFGAPEVLWTSTDPEPQPLWVDVNTHTHANWVFTEPGVYLVQVEASADLIGGEHVTDTRTLRFAVGDAASPEEARLATFADGSDDQEGAAAEAGGDGAARDGTGTDDSGGSSDGSGATRATVAAAIAASAVLLSAGVTSVVVRGNRVKARAERERSGASPADGTAS